MRSTRPSAHNQPLSQVPHLAPHYIAVSGAEVVEVGSTAVWIEQAALAYTSLHGEDLAIWFLEPEESPRVVAVVRPIVNGGAQVYYL